MKSILLIAALGLLVSCGKSSSNSSSPAPEVLPPKIVDASILSQFKNTNISSKLQTLDFTLLTIGTEQSSQDVFLCDGNLGNSGTVNGVSEDSVLATGDEKTGTIQFGHTKYVGASDVACRTVSKESYTYSISGDTLTFCNVNCLNGVYAGCKANPCETFNKL